MTDIYSLPLGEVLRYQAKNRPGKRALASFNQSFSYKELDEITDRVAFYLLQAGFKKGMRAGILMDKNPFLIICFLSVVKAGGVVAVLNFLQKKEALKKTIQDISPFIVLYESQFYHLISTIEKELPLKLVEVCPHKKDPFLWSKGVMIDTRKLATVDPNEVIYLNFTSGITGLPKGVETTSDMIAANTLACVDAFGITDKDVHLCTFAAFAHPHEFFARALYAGGTAIMVDSIFPGKILSTIQEQKVTCLMAIASIYQLLTQVKNINFYKFNWLRIAESGGMAVRESLRRRFKELFNLEILQVWGSTETTGVAIASRPSKTKPNSVGIPCAGYEMKIIDSNGNEVRDNETGELLIKGKGVMKSYFNNPEETKKVLVQGWYHSGDFFRKDEDGFYYLMGRKQGMMKVGGLKVFPAEIETIICQMPQVLDCAIIPKEDPLYGEIPMAFIQLNKIKDKLKDKIIPEFKEKIEEALQNFRVPVEIKIIDQMPYTAGGKIDRDKLKDLLIPKGDINVG